MKLEKNSVKIAIQAKYRLQLRVSPALLVGISIRLGHQEVGLGLIFYCVLNVQSEDTKHKQGKLPLRVIQNVPFAMLGIPNQALDVRLAHVPALPVHLVTNPTQETPVKFVPKDTTQDSLVNKTA